MEDFAMALAPAEIAADDIDLSRIGEWQHVPTSDKPGHRNGHAKVFEPNPVWVLVPEHGNGR